MLSELLCLAFGVPISIIDLRSRRIPDALSFGALALVLIETAVFHSGFLIFSVAGTVTGFAVFWAVWRVTGGKLGFGDVKYSALIGAALGPLGWFWAILAASLLGLATAASLLATRRITREFRIPFAPFLTAGCAVSIFFGPMLSAWASGSSV